MKIGDIVYNHRGTKLRVMFEESKDTVMVYIDDEGYQSRSLWNRSELMTEDEYNRKKRMEKISSIL